MWKAWIIFIVTGFCCKQKDERIPGASYKEISRFLENAGIQNSSVIYFSAGRPPVPLPAIHCFDRNGKPVQVPPSCFANLEAYAQQLGAGRVAGDTSGETLSSFLEKYPVMNAYDEDVALPLSAAADYHLFVWFLAIDEQELGHKLAALCRLVQQPGKRRIQLFLVHAVSERNVRYFKRGGEKPVKRD